MSGPPPDADVLLAVIAAQTAIAGASLRLDAVMELVCGQARDLIGGDGAVVELGDGAEPDHRVAVGSAGDPPAASGSLLCVPLVHGDRRVGVLRVLADRDDAFDDGHATTLGLLHGVIAAQLVHAREHQHVVDAALRDALTGLGNHRAYEERLASETERAIRHGRALSLALIDVIHLDAVNATHGRAAGDAVLVRVAQALCDLRSADYAFRVGGDRFGLLMPETTEGQAEIVVRRVQQTLGRPGPDGLSAPVSIGVRQVRHRDPTILRAATEDALDRAKRVRAVQRHAA